MKNTKGYSNVIASKTKKVQAMKQQIKMFATHVKDSDSDHDQPAGSRLGSRTKFQDELTQLKQLKHDQITDIYANFSTRLNRYLRIKSIQYILNTFYK